MTSYLERFTTYIVNGAQSALAELKQSSGSVPESARMQAWHLLVYALGVDAAWPQVRQLLLALAPHMEMAGYRDEWLTFLHAGVTRSVELQDRDVEAQLSLSIGLLLRLKNDYAASQHWLERALDHFQEQNDVRGIAVAYNQMGRIRYLQHRDEEAVQDAQNALRLLDDDDPERAESFFVLGMAALNQRHWAQAEQNHRLSFSIRQRGGDQRTTAWAIQNVGTMLTQQSEYGGVDRLDEAADWLEKAVDLLESLPDPFHCAVARNSLALVEMQRGQLDQAARLFCLTEVVFQATDSPEWLARVHNNLGLVYLQSAQATEAETSFRSGMALYTALDNHADLLNSQHGLVLALLAQQRYAEAATLCEQGLAGLDALKNMPVQYAEKENWYRTSLAKARVGLQG